MATVNNDVQGGILSLRHETTNLFGRGRIADIQYRDEVRIVAFYEHIGVLVDKVDGGDV